MSLNKRIFYPFDEKKEAFDAKSKLQIGFAIGYVEDYETKFLIELNDNGKHLYEGWLPEDRYDNLLASYPLPNKLHWFVDSMDVILKDTNGFELE